MKLTLSNAALLITVCCLAACGSDDVGNASASSSSSSASSISSSTSSSTSSGQTSSSGSLGQWQLCATEGELCRLPGLSAVRFGKDGDWSEALYEGDVQCLASAFHAPSTGRTRACQYNTIPITEAMPVDSGVPSSTSSSGSVGTPPHHGTVFLDPDVIRPGDPGLYQSMVFVGEAQRSAWHSEDGAVRTFNAYIFDLNFTGGGSVEVAVETTIGSQAQGQSEAEKIAIPLGQIPVILRKNVHVLTVFEGTGRGTTTLFEGLISTYADDNNIKIRDGFLEEFLVHEATHASLDSIYYPNAAYQSAVLADNNYVSTYARDNPTSEDISETVLSYLAVKLRADRISADLEARVRGAIGNRIAFFDDQGLDWLPVQDTSDQVRSEMQAPIPGDTLQGTTVTFTWSAPNNATLFDITIGTHGFGSTNIRSSSPIADSYLTLDTLPDDGTPVYVRLRTQINGDWRYEDYRYQSFNRDKFAAEMLSPEMGTFLNSAELQLKWDRPAGASVFDLHIGDQGPGSDNVRSSELITGTTLNLTQLPLHGQNLYLRLFTKNVDWEYRDYKVVAASDSDRARLFFPELGKAITESTVTFTWNIPIGVSSYDLVIGTTRPGSDDIRSSDVVTTNSVTVNNIPTDGRPIYVRLWAFKDSWNYTDYEF